MSKPETDLHAAPGGTEPRLSRASVARFSLYLRHLERFQLEGVHKVSSGMLGEAMGITDAQVRKDLAYLGSLGQPGIGYPAADLIAALRQRLGVDREWTAIVVGIGNLARALLRYKGFEKHGFRFVALFDADAEKVGRTVEGLPILPLTKMKDTVAQTGAELAVLAVPMEAAQTVADAAVDAGIKGILNFAPMTPRVPPGVSVVGVDLAIQLEQLAFLVHLGQTDGRPEPR